MTRSPRNATSPESPVPQGVPDRLAQHDRPKPPGPRTEPTAPLQVEPHWESVIAAATD